MSGFTAIDTAPKWDCHNGIKERRGETEGWVGYIGATDELGLRIIILWGEAKRSGAWAFYQASLCMRMFVSMHVCVCMSVCVSIRPCVCIRICVCPCMFVHVYVCVHVFVFMCVCACTCLYVYMSVCLCVFIVEFTEVDWPCQNRLIFQMIVLSVTTLLSRLICAI